MLKLSQTLPDPQRPFFTASKSVGACGRLAGGGAPSLPAPGLFTLPEQPPRPFHCSLWPGCGCPGGTVHPDCPGLRGRGGDPLGDCGQSPAGRASEKDARI